MADNGDPKGIIGFNATEKDPSWKLGTIISDPNALFAWLKGEGAQYITEYEKDSKKTKQIKLTVGRGNKGLNISVDTWKPDASKSKAPAPEPDNDPF